MPLFNGSLNANKVFASLFNMIISQQLFDTGISNLTGIYDSRRVDGGLFGDTKLYKSTDGLKTYLWDGTDTPGSYNLLSISRPPAPAIDKIVIDQFRQIWTTVDDYLTKQAFVDEGSFSDFNGIWLSWLTKTKEVYEHTKYTTDILIAAQNGATSLGAIALAAPADVTGYDLIKWRAQELYRQIEDFMTELNEPSRLYNDLGFLRNYKIEDFDIIVPIGVLSSVRKHDVPFLYNADSKPIFKEIPWKYFGTVITADGTTAATNTTIRSRVEIDYGLVHLMPGDLLPNATAYLKANVYTATYVARPTLGTAMTILFVHKKDFPIMSAFSTGSSFFNARRLDQNHYLTFGHNNVYDSHLREYALLKVTTTV